jgi:low temperature requirement protein LtrA
MNQASPSNDRGSQAEAKVSFIELFFDLVFVFAVTQLSHHLVEHLTVAGTFETALLLLAVWTVWSYTTWSTNWLDTGRTSVRLMLLGLMASGLVVSTAIPEAFGRTGLAFAVSYALMQNGRSLFGLCSLEARTRPIRLNLYRIQFWLFVAGVLWIAGGLSHGAARILLWSVAVAVELGSPWWGFWTPGIGPSTTTDWNVSGHHFAERCGLFVIIALGESILVTGATFSRLETTWPVVVAFATAFAASVAMWWVYFFTTADEASHALAASSDPGRLARAAYTYSHLPLVAGIIVTAVGDELVLAHPGGSTGVAAVATIIGGPALFLVGSALFNRMMCGGWPASSHGVGLVLLALCVPLARIVPPVGLSAAATLVLWIVGLWESVTSRRRE